MKLILMDQDHGRSNMNRADNWIDNNRNTMWWLTGFAFGTWITATTWQLVPEKRSGWSALQGEEFNKTRTVLGGQIREREREIWIRPSTLDFNLWVDECSSKTSITWIVWPDNNDKFSADCQIYFFFLCLIHYCVMFNWVGYLKWKCLVKNC